MSGEPVAVDNSAHASGAPQGTNGVGHESDIDSAHDGVPAPARVEAEKLSPGGASSAQTDGMDVDEVSHAPPPPPPPPQTFDGVGPSDAIAATDDAQPGGASSSAREGEPAGDASLGEGGAAVAGLSGGAGEGMALGMVEEVPEELSGVASAVGEAQRRLAEAARRLQEEARAGGPQKKESVAQAVATVRTILRNVMQHPGEHKFRTVKKTNKVFKNAVAQFPAAIELLRVAGFREKDEGQGGGLGDAGEGQVLHCRAPDPALLWLACSTLDQLSC